MQWCTPPVCMIWVATCLSCTTTSPNTQPSPLRCTSMAVASGKVSYLLSHLLCWSDFCLDIWSLSSLTLILLPSGNANASFCPHGYGCRSVLIAENQIILDVTDHDVIVTVRVPEGKTLWLVSDLCAAHIF